MKSKIIRRLAIKNIAKNKELSIPFVLASSFVSAMFYVIFSLRSNEFVRTRHDSLIIIISIGVVVVFVLALIFMTYAGGFIQKRRGKEFALYQILGLEKRHLKKVLLLESSIHFLMISILSIMSGFLFGKIFFMLLNRLVDTGGLGRFEHYLFDTDAGICTGILVLVAISISYFKNLWVIRRLNPMELGRSQQEGEKEPKGNIVLVCIGILMVGSGYIIALASKSTLGALEYILIAILLVLFGTYFLFTSVSIRVLRILRKNKDRYYRTHRFLFISQMIYRMRSNAISLASISILYTGILLTVTSTVSIYQGVSEVAQNSLVGDYQISSKDKGVLQGLSSRIQKDIKGSEKVLTSEVFSAVDLSGDSLRPLLKGSKNVGRALFLKARTLSGHEALFREKLEAKDDTIYLSTNMEDYKFPRKMKIADKLYKVDRLDNKKTYISSRLGAEVLYIVVPKGLGLEELGRAYPSYNFDEKVYEPTEVGYNLDIRVQNDGEEVYEKIKQICKEGSADLISRIKVRQFIYELDGGFLFIGILICLILLAGTVLMLYFKQITEGYDDIDKYKTMMKIGLDDRMVRKTIRQQVVWIFFLPLLVAIVHSIVASKQIINLIGLFGVRNSLIFYLNFVVVSVVFSLAYMLIYKATSKAYYKLIR